MKNDLHLKRALHTTLLLLLLSLAGIGKGYAYDFVLDGIYYNITSSSQPKTVEVTYRNENYNSYSGTIEVPNTVTYNGETYSVVKIGNYAFHNCSGMTSISLPNSLKSIKYMAFSFCRGLTTITIPESVEIIEVYAFLECTNLITINYKATNCSQIGGVYPTGWEMAFVDCTAFTTLNISENVQIIPDMAFTSCSALTTINFNAINCLVGNYAFEGCVNLTTLHYGDGVRYVDARNFRGFNNLINITIPNSVTSINFIDTCAPAGNDNAGFSGTGWYNNQPNGILYLDGWCLGFKGDMPTGDLIIQEGTRGIGDHAFLLFPMENVFFTNTLLYIGNDAFESCNNLKHIFIPNSVVSIGQFAFAGCNDLVSISLGSSVACICDYAFYCCSELNTIISINTTPPILGNNVFNGISSFATLFVPCGSQLAYFSNWNLFEYQNIHEDCTPRPVSISLSIIGGTVIPSVSQASMGQEVFLMVTPNEGMTLSSLMVYNANDPTQIIPVNQVGKATSTYRFTMPPFGVVVMASFETGTSVNEIIGDIPVMVYPNPTNGLIKLEAESLKSISIFNLIGQHIFNGQAVGNEFEFDFSNHEAGVYLIRIETANGVATKRVVLTK